LLADGSKAQWRCSLLSTIRLKDSARVRLRRLSQFRRGQQRWLTEQAALARDQATLTVEQKARVQDVFSHYDADGSATLDALELREALADLGYTPRSREEKRHFSELLARFGTDSNGELILEEFECLVAELMKHCREEMQAEIKEQLQIHDLDGSGKLHIDEVLLLLDQLNIGPRTPEENNVVVALLDKVNRTRDEIEERERQRQQDGTSAKRGSVAEKLEKLFVVMNTDEISVDSMEELEWENVFSTIRETIGALRRARLHSLVAKGKLDPEVVAELCDELVELQDRFDAHNEEMEGHTGLLEREDLHVLLADHGMRPQTKPQRERVHRRISEAACVRSDGLFDFPTTLAVILSVRQVAKEARQEELEEIFEMFDKDDSGNLSVQECSQMLARMGLNPKTRAQQRQIAIILESVDLDGSGDYSFDEVAVLFQRVVEMLGRESRKAELAIAKELGSSARMVEEHHEIFVTLDQEDRGELKVKELRQLVDTIRAPIPGDLLNDMIFEVDADGSGLVEFAEFLRFMAMVSKYCARSKNKPITGGADVAQARLGSLVK